MKKIILLVLVLSFLLCSCGKSDVNPSNNQTSENVTSAENAETTTVEDGPITYYSENINNKYIVAVAKKYGVDKNYLIALIRTNTDNPGATVLQFSGKKDSNNVLLKTEDELVYVYDVDDKTNTIKKASGKVKGNDGYSFAESVAVFHLTKEYILPQLDVMKKERPYQE